MPDSVLLVLIMLFLIPALGAVAWAIHDLTGAVRDGLDSIAESVRERSN